MTLPAHKLGDKGQRFEVHYITAETKEDKVFGWANLEKSALQMCQSIALWPHAESSYAIDRTTGEIIKHEA